MDFWGVVGSIFWFMILFAWIMLLFRIFGDLFSDHEFVRVGQGALDGVPDLPAVARRSRLPDRARSLDERARHGSGTSAASRRSASTSGRPQEPAPVRPTSSASSPTSGTGAPSPTRSSSTPRRSCWASSPSPSPRLHPRAPGSLHDVNRESRPPSPETDGSAAADATRTEPPRTEPPKPESHGPAAGSAPDGRTSGSSPMRSTERSWVRPSWWPPACTAPSARSSSRSSPRCSCTGRPSATPSCSPPEPEGGFSIGGSVMAALRHGWPMLESSYSPVVVLLVASFLGAELKTAVLAALCLSTLLLAGLGYGAARRSDATVRRRSRVGGHERPARRGRHRLEAGTALTMTPSPAARSAR